MKICHRHDAVYNEQTGGCPVCELRISDPENILCDDIVKVETDILTVIERGRVIRVAKADKGWLIYDLEEKALKCVTLRCVVIKLEETYDNARKS
jgi:hypothetical protein